MLPAVGWSWLTEALEQNGAAHVALGGTVTQTSSVRFGDIAGPRRDDDVELRASWTPVGRRSCDLRHAEAFCTLVATAAGLPPVGDRPSPASGARSGDLTEVSTSVSDVPQRDQSDHSGRVDRSRQRL